MFGIHTRHGEGRRGCGPRGRRWLFFGPGRSGGVDDDPGEGPRGGRGGRRFGGPPGSRRGRRVFEPGALRIAVLQLVAERPRHGYDVIRALEERFHGTYSPSPGAIYPLLQMFEEADYVVAAQEGAKKLYSITEQGRAFLEENKELAARLESRMERVSAEMRGAELGEAIGAFRSALFRRLRGRDLHPEQIERVRRILDEARERIEAL